MKKNNFKEELDFEKENGINGLGENIDRNIKKRKIKRKRNIIYKLS